MDFLNRIVSIFAGGDDPERDKKRKLKLIGKQLRKMKQRFYKPRGQEALPAMARFFFDKGLANLSPIQAAQLAASVRRLTGRGGPGLLSGVRESLGVDDFDVVTGEDGAAALQVGKYLSENIYTDVTTSTNGQSAVNLNIDVTDTITLKGSADSAGETSVGIFFERDY
jgi:translocation and assembly module TamB